MIAPPINSPTFSPPAHVVALDQGSLLESFSRQAPDPSWDRWMHWLADMDRQSHIMDNDILTPPSHEVIAQAMSLLGELQEANAPYPPSSVALEPNGGIIIERRLGHRTISITIYDDLRVDADIYEAGRLIASNTMREPSSAYC